MRHVSDINRIETIVHLLVSRDLNIFNFLASAAPFIYAAYKRNNTHFFIIPILLFSLVLTNFLQDDPYKPLLFQLFIISFGKSL